MATLGVLYRDRKEIAASIIGQTRNLHYPVIDADIEQTMYSEQADMLYQGISRGNSRRTFDGKAGEQHIYLFHPESDIKKMMALLCDVMPQANWIEYQPQVMQKPVRQNAEEYLMLGAQIVDLLLFRTPLATQSVSTRSIREQIAPEVDSNGSTWRNALKHAKGMLFGWERKGQSFVRSSIGF